MLGKKKLRFDFVDWFKYDGNQLAMLAYFRHRPNQREGYRIEQSTLTYHIEVVKAHRLGAEIELNFSGAKGIRGTENLKIKFTGGKEKESWNLFGLSKSSRRRIPRKDQTEFINAMLLGDEQNAKDKFNDIVFRFMRDCISETANKQFKDYWQREDSKKRKAQRISDLPNVTVAKGNHNIALGASAVQKAVNDVVKKRIKIRLEEDILKWCGGTIERLKQEYAV